MTRKTWKTESRLDYGNDVHEDSGLTIEAINAGSLQRIADATEKMAVRHTDLMRERDSFKASRDYWEKQYEDAVRSNRSLRGQITKLKNALAAARSLPQGAPDA